MKHIENQKSKYHVLARALIIDHDYILVAHCKGMANTFLPGGHAEFREGIRSSLSREIMEELGQECIVKDYVGCVEAHFDYSEVFHQEINHLFIVDLPKINRNINPESIEDHLEFYWIPIEQMKEHNLQPYPIREVIQRYIHNESGPFWGTTLMEDQF